MNLREVDIGSENKLNNIQNLTYYLSLKIRETVYPSDSGRFQSVVEQIKISLIYYSLAIYDIFSNRLV